MTKKQLKLLAKKLAGLEHIIQTSDDASEVRQAKEEVQKLSVNLELDDMIKLDMMIQENLKSI